MVCPHCRKPLGETMCRREAMDVMGISVTKFKTLKAQGRLDALMVPYSTRRYSRKRVEEFVHGKQRTAVSMLRSA